MKKEQNEKQERNRKVYAPAGQRAQKMMTLRVDLENLEWLQTKPNKGRYINDLIAADRARHLSQSGAETGGIGGG